MGKILDFRIGYIDGVRVMYYHDNAPSGIPYIVLKEGNNKYNRMHTRVAGAVLYGKLGDVPKISKVVIAKDESVTNVDIENTIKHNLNDFNFCLDCVATLPYSVRGEVLLNKFDSILIRSISRLTSIGRRVFIWIGEKEVEIVLYEGGLEKLKAKLESIHKGAHE